MFLRGKPCWARLRFRASKMLVRRELDYQSRWFTERLLWVGQRRWGWWRLVAVWWCQVTFEVEAWTVVNQFLGWLYCNSRCLVWLQRFWSDMVLLFKVLFRVQEESLYFSFPCIDHKGNLVWMSIVKVEIVVTCDTKNKFRVKSVNKAIV